MNWLEFFPQCCDALEYLEQGMECVAGKYYNNLRPVGASLWFSLPYRLSLPPESLILGHFLLLIVSTLLSTLVFYRIISKNAKEINSQRKWLVPALIFILSIIIHGISFYPVMFYSLADAPAGFLALFGIWFLLLHTSKPSAIYLGISGAALGLAAWVRTYYLYPVIFGMIIYLILWMTQRERKFAELIFLIALAPILLQYFWTYHNYGYFSYLHDEKASWWTEVHLSSNALGKDSRLPGIENRWPSGCDIERGFLGILENKDFPGVVCLFSKRLQFYFGSYSPLTYIEDPSQRKWSNWFLLLNFAGIIGGGWFYFRNRNALGHEGILTLILLIFILGEGMIIMPEQRFVISLNVMVWMAFVSAIFQRF